MVPRGDPRADAGARDPTEQRHERLEAAEEEREAQGVGPGNVPGAEASGGGDRGRVHGEADGEQQDGGERHHGVIVPRSTWGTRERADDVPPV